MRTPSDDFLLLRSGGRPASYRGNNKLAGSVNILPQLGSIYGLEGELRNGTEHKSSIKACAARLGALQKRAKICWPLRCSRDIAF
ncbi:MAG: divalent-cation tolerance protein CutA [Gammaproteobacteria bacterium]|nr:divalent-cation tolerance protein CutA [Gammaproteobacteria bacterium]